MCNPDRVSCLKVKIPEFTSLVSKHFPGLIRFQFIESKPSNPLNHFFLRRFKRYPSIPPEVGSAGCLLTIPLRLLEMIFVAASLKTSFDLFVEFLQHLENNFLAILPNIQEGFDNRCIWKNCIFVQSQLNLRNLLYGFRQK